MVKFKFYFIPIVAIRLLILTQLKITYVIIQIITLTSDKQSCNHPLFTHTDHTHTLTPINHTNLKPVTVVNRLSLIKLLQPIVIDHIHKKPQPPIYYMLSIYLFALLESPGQYNISILLTT